MDKKYTSEEIFHDKKFLQWMQEPERLGENFWKSYASQNSENFQSVQSAIDLYNELYTERDDVDLLRMEHQKNLLIRGINFQDQLRKLRYAGLTVSGIALFVLGVWYWGLFDYQMNTSGSEQIVVEETSTHFFKENLTDQSQPLELPDGTFVFLDPGSSIAYNSTTFDEFREVKLVGSAFFMVEKKGGAQFVVNSDHFETTVLGTEFYVNDNAIDLESFVKVTEGRVSVKSKKGDELAPVSEMLTQMESIHLNKTDLSVYRKSEDLNTLLNSKEKIHNESYKDVSLDSVFTDLSRQFKIEIKYNKEQLQNCTITASFEGKKLDEVLYIICRLMNASYLEEDGQILIFSKGC